MPLRVKLPPKYSDIENELNRVLAEIERMINEPKATREIGSSELPSSGYIKEGEIVHVDSEIEEFSTPSAWAASTSYSLLDRVIPTSPNGFYYQAISISGTGLSGSSEPTWPTKINETKVDNEVTWRCEGRVESSKPKRLAFKLNGKIYYINAL